MLFGSIRNFEVQGMCCAIRDSLVNLSTTIALWNFAVRWSLILKDANEHTALRSSILGALIRLTYWTWDQSHQKLDSHHPLSGSRQRFTTGKLRKKKSLVGDIAQWVNYLPHKCKDLSSNPQNSCEAGNSSILLSHAPLVRWKRETEESLGPIDQLGEQWWTTNRSSFKQAPAPEVLFWPFHWPFHSHIKYTCAYIRYMHILILHTHTYMDKFLKSPSI